MGRNFRICWKMWAAAGILILTGVLMFLTEKRITDSFGEVTFDQILFHLSLPRGVINPELERRCFKLRAEEWCILAIAVGFFLAVLPCFFRRKGRLRAALRIAVLVLSGIFSGYMLYRTDNAFGISSCLWNRCQRTDLIDRFYRGPGLDDFCVPEKRSNLILIVSESLESTFANPLLCGENLIPELAELRKRGSSVPGHCHVWGCHYTIAAMYAIHYGLPLLYFSCTNGDPVQGNIFRKKCVSVCDVLAHAGYRIAHIQGSPLKFASQSSLFSHISGVRLLGEHEFPVQEISHRQYWGLYDRDLFRFCRREAVRLAGKGEPFVLSIQTVDTHAGNQAEPGTAGKYGDIRDLIRLQSRLIGEFTDWVFRQPWGGNTVMVILGDHDMMAESIGPVRLPGRRQRPIYNCILNARNGLHLRPRIAAAFDFAPTVLDALGFRWEGFALGVGRSLYRKAPTVLESCGMEVWNRESQKRSELYMRLILPTAP